MDCEGGLNGSALLELQHCVEILEERDLANLKFAVSSVDVDQGSNSKFELREGDFVGSSGKLEIAHFLAWRVAIVAMQSSLGLPSVLQVGLYYQKVSPAIYIHSQFSCCSQARCLGKGILHCKIIMIIIITNCYALYISLLVVY